jgi:hypothetical protein
MSQDSTQGSSVDITSRGVSSVSGGINISGGSVSVGGDMVARDKIVGNKVSGMNVDDVAKLFDSIYARIGQHPAEDQPDIRRAVDTIKAAATREAVGGQEPDEEAVKAASQTLALNAPDLLTDMADVALATLANPAAGVVTLVRKIAQKAKSLRR